MSLTIKVALADENRRITVNKSISFEDLSILLNKLFNGVNIAKIEYLDDEKEWIRISTDLELEEAKKITSGDILRLRLNSNVTANKTNTTPTDSTTNPINNLPQILPDLFSIFRNFIPNIDVEVVDSNYRNRRSGGCPFMNKTHYGVTCDGCNQNPIVGIRYKCDKCNNFDFCEKCYQQGNHDKSHTFKVIQYPARRCRRNPCHFQPGSNVHFGISCDGCDQYPLVGIRYKCEQCGDFDFCEKCYQQGNHDKSHTFKVISKPVSAFYSYCEKEGEQGPKTEIPKTEIPKTEIPKVEVPKVEIPKVEVPKVEPLKTELPKVQTPKPEVPLVKPVEQPTVVNKTPDTKPTDSPKVEPIDWAASLKELKEMGFVDVRTNIQLLKKYNGSLERVVNELVRLSGL